MKKPLSKLPALQGNRIQCRQFIKTTGTAVATATLAARGVYAANTTPKKLRLWARRRSQPWFYEQWGGLETVRNR